MAELTLVAANTIIAAALEAGAKAGFKPLTVAVLDAGGHLKAFQKQDGASMLRYEIAFGKAYGSLAVGMGSRWLDKNAKERPHFIEGLTAVSGGRIVAVPGGVLIRDAAGTLLGAVGVTGDTSDNDEICAVAGIEAAGLVAQVD
ncbi:MULTISPECIES: heme-binding protein [unclassified Shinella]|uniref:GlcG/HbpS family heme-binding protein n=1 Tax=unclassified Shinella TaxID=2643062 RepID=UPI00225CF8E0|nr:MULTISPECIES: heme-binding protein [unclassified Shinella]MCO5139738.1 heme-binding protein [Shinella sp.]MDC7258625.1 heme-binding protein [Shinella sp. YE25]CAI0334969.1 GlcG protein [Rhizobiaceae bacterium]CAK7260389.1 glc operon protein GlcG [Shinella sp. WSC3-e]